MCRKRQEKYLNFLDNKDTKIRRGCVDVDWTENIRRSIDYMENHLMEQDVLKNVSKEVFISSFYLEKGFKMMTGYSMSEYIRYRRLYLSALDVIKNDQKVIDIAYKYGYDTPESFTKSFSRFHGVSPTSLKKDTSKMKVFLPLRIKVIIQGGNDMDFVVEKMNEFKLIGFEREFSLDTSYEEVPKYWNEIFEKYVGPLMKKDKPETEIEEAICSYGIGEYGVSIDDGRENEGMFKYMVAGAYTGGKVPEGMKVYEVPETDWAKFACKGPIPGALQSVNRKIFNEWLPGNPDYEISMGTNIEWYSKEGTTTSIDYESAIWVPVKKKN